MVAKWPGWLRIAAPLGFLAVGWSLIYAAIVIPGALLPVASLFFACLSAMCFALALARMRGG